MKRVSPSCIPVLCFFIAFSVFADPVREERSSSGNSYIAGGNIIISTPVEGDLMAAGGDVKVEQEISADAALAGGSVELHAPVGQDLRAAGGTVNINSNVGGELFATGGTVRLARSARVAEDARLSGSDVMLAGEVAKDVRIYANKITVSGRIGGDAHLYGQRIVLQPGARIGGNLYYASPDPIAQDRDVVIGGTITREEMPAHWGERGRAGVLAFFHPIFVISMLVAGMLLFLLFPNAVHGTANTIRQYPWSSLLIGAALLFLIPPVAIFFMITVIGIPIGLVLLLLYPLVLLLGYLGAAFFIGRRAADAMKQPDRLRAGRQTMFLAAALIVLSLIALIPFVGGFLIMLALFLGIGGWAVWMTRIRNTESGAI